MKRVERKDIRVGLIVSPEIEIDGEKLELEITSINDGVVKFNDGSTTTFYYLLNYYYIVGEDSKAMDGSAGIKKEDLVTGAIIKLKDSDSYGETGVVARIENNKVYYTDGEWDHLDIVLDKCYLAQSARQIGGNHYNNENDPIKFANDNYPPEQLEGFFRINVDKYMARYHKKNGIEDLKKAKHYLELLLELKQNEQSN